MTRGHHRGAADSQFSEAADKTAERALPFFSKRLQIGHVHEQRSALGTRSACVGDGLHEAFGNGGAPEAPRAHTNRTDFNIVISRESGKIVSDSFHPVVRGIDVSKI